MLQQEAVQGTPEPKQPELVKPRANVVGSTDLAKQLLEKQREKAAAHTRAFYAQHHDGVFVAFKMTRTRVPDPKQHVGVKFKKLFENAEWWDGVVSECHDDVQRWRVTHQDGDVEDFTVASMQQHLGHAFVCGEPRGPDAGLAAPQTASALREGNRRRRLTGRRDPLDGVVAELQDITAGLEFSLPARRAECAGTTFKLLRVHLEDATGRNMAVYCPADEAESTPQEDIDNLHLDDLEREHDVTVAVYSKVQAWIAASAETATAVTSTEGLRRSGRNRDST